MIIDSHIVVEKNKEHLTTYDQFLFSSGFNKGYRSSKQILSDMDKDGVDVSIIMQGSNEKRLEYVKMHPDRLAAFADVSILELKNNISQTLNKAKQYIDEGFLGFGQIQLYRYGLNIDEESFIKLVELSVNLDVPIYLECSIDFGDYEAFKINSPLYDLEALAVQFPALKLILSSWGNGLCLFEMMPELPKLLKNTYYESTCFLEGFDIQTMLTTASKVASPHRLIYGSGVPQNYRRIQEIKSTVIPKEVIDGFLGRNLSLLLGLNKK